MEIKIIEREEIDYNRTLAFMASQIGIELWQVMEIMKYKRVSK